MHHRCRTLAALPLLILLCSPTARSQTYPPGSYPPGSYPPGSYPPGSYPPGSYPPGSYPPNTIPARLPGGTGVGIPVPEIKLPKRGSKTEGKEKDEKKAGTNDREVRIALKPIEGTLRRMTEKELLLETGDSTVLQFRLLAKTTFKNPQGEPVRDSLLKPGDQLKVDVNPDDEETALRVTLVRAGTPAERAAAARPVEAGQIRKPESASGEQPAAGTADTSERGTDADGRPRLKRGKPEVYRTASTERPASAERPASSERPAPAAASTPAAPPVVAAPNLPPQDQFLEEAREAAGTFSDDLPNFVVQQFTTRYVSTTVPVQWQALDVVGADVISVNNKEEYKNITINGRPAKRAIEKTGAWSTGEFTTILEDTFSPTTAALFAKRREDQIAGKTAVVYDFTVKQTTSHWQVHTDTRVAVPAYKGSMWIDKASHRVLRIEQQTLSLPADFEFDKAETLVDYDQVRIGTQSFLLPVHAESLLCERGKPVCSKNVIEFRNYRKFGSESNIQFEKPFVNQTHE